MFWSFLNFLVNCKLILNVIIYLCRVRIFMIFYVLGFVFCNLIDRFLKIIWKDRVNNKIIDLNVRDFGLWFLMIIWGCFVLLWVMLSFFFLVLLCEMVLYLRFVEYLLFCFSLIFFVNLELMVFDCLLFLVLFGFLWDGVILLMLFCFNIIFM